jgi:hypothetical protein
LLQTPPARRRAPLQRVGAARLEVDLGADDEVLDRAGDEHLAGVREGADPRADIDRDPGYVVAADLALAGVQAGAHLDPQPADGR